MGEMTKMLDEVTPLIARLKDNYPAEINSFLSFMNKAENGPALAAREKKLISVGIAVAPNASGALQFTSNMPSRRALRAMRSRRRDSWQY